MCSTVVRRASSETAMRAAIFSSTGRTMGKAIRIARDRSFAVWNVATIGPSAMITASPPRLGVTGSWTWSTSNCPAVSHRRTRRALIGPKLKRATEPL